MTDIELRDSFGRSLHRFAGWFADVGGLLMLSMTILVVVSIVGRALFSRPVPGDFEIVGLGSAISIFLFLPHCYLRRGNVAVDIFIARMPRSVQVGMDMFAALLFGALSALFVWRMIFGFIDTVRYWDISMILGVPLWLAYPFAILSFGLLSLCCLYRASRIPWDPSS